jgi:hypothetical protein
LSCYKISVRNTEKCHLRFAPGRAKVRRTSASNPDIEKTRVIIRFSKKNE